MPMLPYPNPAIPQTNGCKIGARDECLDKNNVLSLGIERKLLPFDSLPNIRLSDSATVTFNRKSSAFRIGRLSCLAHDGFEFPGLGLLEHVHQPVIYVHQKRHHAKQLTTLRLGPQCLGPQCALLDEGSLLSVASN